MLYTLTLLGLISQASTLQITGYGNTTADYGSDAHYTCTVADPTGVLQVTWQRLLKDDSSENLAAYSERFGQKVNEPYRGKVVFGESSLSSTSITVKSVTWADDGCYMCYFNVYPGGSKAKQTCLTVQGISEVKTGVQAPGGEDGVEVVVFQCSATGKPAPTVQWAYSPGASASSQSQPATVTNSDHTFTSSSNISLQVPADWSGHVDCLLNSGMTGERRERIPFAVGPEREEDDGRGRRMSLSGVVLVIFAVIVTICVAAAAALIKRKRLKDSRRDENV